MGTVVELPWRRNNLSGDSNSKTLKMPKMIFQVLILVSGWAAQTLEGSPTAGLDLQENLQENQIGTQHLTPELLRNLQVNKAEMSQMWSGLERSRETVAKVEARLEELWQRVDALGPTIDTKLERLMEDLMEKIEVKEKRSLQSTENFATAEQMDQVMKVFQELRDLPRNVSSMMSAAKQEMSQSLSQAVSRDELGNCSSTRGNGGWWFNGCGLANLNGLNLPSGATGYEGILWYFYAKDNRSFKS